MLNTIDHLLGAKLSANDGDIGHVTDAYFDDRSWAVRYLVVDTGHWLGGREVLISPYSVNKALGADKHIHLALTRKQVQHSPNVDTHQPVSRQQERELLRYYAYPEYWVGDAMWGMGEAPMTAPQSPTEGNRSGPHDRADAGAAHLRSSAHVTGYDIEATDGSIGHVQDFVFDDHSWAIRYLIVDTRNWWPGGRKVLIAVDWADQIDWATRSVAVRLSREQVRASPPFEDVSSIHREYESRLHQSYQRSGYWEKEGRKG